MPVIYIRHGDDSYSDPTREHDRRLTSSGYGEAKEKTLWLVEKYGYPTRIYTSPFKRAVQTVKAMERVIKKRGHNVEVIKDWKLSRYFSSREKENPQVYDETARAGAPIQESWEEFQRRCRSHMRGLKRDGTYRGKEIVWCITHALVLKEVARKYGVTLPEHIPFLHHFRIRHVEKDESSKKSGNRDKSSKRKEVRMKRRGVAYDVAQSWDTREYRTYNKEKQGKGTCPHCGR